MASNERTSVGIVSDTHGYLDPFLLEAFADCVAILHAGDVGRVEVLEDLEQVAPVVAVKGNIDGGELRHLPTAHIEEIEGIRIAILHIAGDARRPRAAARDLIRSKRPDVFIAGHTHVPVVGKVGETLWINPGAAGIEGHHDLRFAAILHIEPDGQLGMDRIHLGSRSSRR